MRLSQDVAAGRLDTRAHGPSDNEVGDLVRSLGDMVDPPHGPMLTVRAATDHINTAVADPDRMTQQNAALVEEGAAAAESLHEQASKLLAVVSGFQLGTATASFATPPAVVLAQTRGAAPVPTPPRRGAAFL